MKKMSKWVESMISVLENTKYPQIKERLVQYDEDGKIIGKCVLGEFKCAKNIITDDVIDRDSSIMDSFKVPADLSHEKHLPKLEIDWEDDNISYINFEDSDKIQDWLYKLNDLGFTYPQIKEWLETTFE